MAKIITPPGLQEGLTDFHRDRVNYFRAKVITTGLQPKAKEIIALTPPFLRASSTNPTFLQLHVDASAAGAPATADLVLFETGEPTRWLKLKDIDGTAADNNFENLQTDQVAAAGVNLIHRVWPRSVQIGIRWTAAAGAAIAANKQALVSMLYIQNKSSDAEDRIAEVA